VVSVTVLLPVYNAGRPLHAAIDSVLAQDERDFELLIVDDASPDDSASVIRSYAERDPRIRAIYHDRNRGLAATLNEGLELATGELVVRMDQDDESLPSRIRVQSEFMRAHPEVAVAGSHVLHMGAKPAYDRLIRLPTDAREIRETLPRVNCMYHPSVVMRRNVVLELGG